MNQTTPFNSAGSREYTYEGWRNLHTRPRRRFTLVQHDVCCLQGQSVPVVRKQWMSTYKYLCSKAYTWHKTKSPSAHTHSFYSYSTYHIKRKQTSPDQPSSTESSTSPSSVDQASFVHVYSTRARALKSRTCTQVAHVHLVPSMYMHV